MIFKIDFLIEEGACEDESEEEHCQRLSYVVEGKSISTRCSGNCACCKVGNSFKKSKLPQTE